MQIKRRTEMLRKSKVTHFPEKDGGEGFKVSTSSKDLSAVVVKNYGLTLYTPFKKPGGKFETCTSAAIHTFFKEKDPDTTYVHNTDPYHPLVHSHPDELFDPHVHILIKNKAPTDSEKATYRLIDPENVRDFLEYLQKECSPILCETEKDCVLSEEDKRIILQEYEKYYSEHRSKEKWSKAIDVSIEGFKTFGNTLATTFIFYLIDHYLHPYLLEKQYTRKTAGTMTHAMKLATSGLLYRNLSAIFLSQSLTGIILALKIAGFDESLTEKLDQINTRISIVAGFLNPKNLLLSFLTATPAIKIGEKMAAEVIHHLPKFRQEPESSEISTEAIIETESTTLRNRM